MKRSLLDEEQVTITLDETFRSNLLHHKFKYQTTELQLFFQYVPVLYWHPLSIMIGTTTRNFTIDSCIFSAAVRNPLHVYTTVDLINGINRMAVDSDSSDDDSEESDDQKMSLLQRIYCSPLSNESLDKRKLLGYLKSLLDDELFVLQVMNDGEHFLEYVSDRLKDNEMIVLGAVKQFGIELEYASERLKDNEMVVMEAIKQNGDALEYASDRLQENEEFILAATKQKGSSVVFQNYSSLDQVSSKDIFEIDDDLVRNDISLSFASESLKDNELIVLEAIKQSGISLLFASHRLRDDEEFVLEAVKQSGDAFGLCFASDRLKDNELIVLEAIKQSGISLTYASHRLRDDKSIVLEAVKQDGSALLYASDRLRNDIDFANEIFHSLNNLNIFKGFGKELLNIEFILNFIEQYQSRFHELIRR